MHILIVKMSSMGDIIHTLPAVTDAVRANPGLRFDWVVEEAFTEIPALHPAVERVIPVAIRRWRTNWLKTFRAGDVGQFRSDLKKVHYDLVIDAQGLIKSGIVSRMSRGLTLGLSNSTIREPLATLFYNQKYSVPTDMHAVQRVRELFSRAFNYRFDASIIDYGIDDSRISGIQRDDSNAGTDRPTLIFLHGTTWENKLWPRAYWRDLAARSVDGGYDVLLPWGNLEEKARAEDIAKVRSRVTVLPAQSLTELAGQMKRADAAVAVDTGLAHLAAALDVPVVALYGPTDPSRSGTWGRNQVHLRSTLECAPCMRRKCLYEGAPVTDKAGGRAVVVVPPCFASNPPAQVFEHVDGLVNSCRSTRLAVAE